MTTRARSISHLGLSLACALVTGSALAALIGARSDLDPVLVDLIEPLHQRGIDVVAGNASLVGRTSQPRVAMLSGMPTKRPVDFKWRDWMTDFQSGAVGVVAGVQVGDVGREATDDVSFFEDWARAPKDKRVFLSFTAADVDAASQAAAALRQQGYVTFIYLNREGQTPRYSAEVTGRFFSQAGHYLVLDTRSARDSHGVWLESWFASRFNPRDGGDGLPGGRSQGPRPKRPTGPSPTTIPVDSGQSSEMQEFRAGVQGHWVVTENPELRGKLFVHRTEQQGFLLDLLYRVQVEPDGSWTVYRPTSARNGSLGIRLGTIPRPSGVEIGPCGCR